MADPLSLLREYNINRKTIIEHNGMVIFGSQKWPKDVETRFIKSMSTSKGETSGKDRYTLECLLYFLKHASDNHAVYVRQAAADNIPVVNRPDRRILIAYLNGEITTDGEHIDKSSDNAVHLKHPCVIYAHEEMHEDGNFPKRPRIEEEDEVKKQLQERLDINKKESHVDFTSLKSLSDAMSVEKIAAIKAKRLSNKRAAIKSDSGYDVDSMGLFDFDAEAMREILKHQKPGRNRNKILQTKERDFSKNVFVLLDSIKKRIRGLNMAQNKNLIQSPSPKLPVEPTKAVEAEISAHYSRYDQERFIQDKGVIREFAIDTTGTNLNASLFVKNPPNDQQQQHATVFEHFSADATVLMPPPAPPASILPRMPATTAPRVLNKRKARTPIIIIPSTTTGLISMYNARDILEDLNFVSTDERKASKMKRPNEVIIQRRKSPQHTVPYRVTDQFARLTAEEWNLVVAVFVFGPAWQFKGWPWGGNPIEIFAQIPAFHLHFADMKLDENVERWAVTVLKISKTKRHLDKASLSQFWKTVDDHIIKNKPGLRF